MRFCNIFSKFVVLVFLFVSMHTFLFASSASNLKGTKNADQQYKYSNNKVLAKAIKSIDMKNTQHAIIGYEIKNLGGGNVIASENVKHLFTPASINKVMVAGVALQELGKNYKFITSMGMRGKVRNHVLRGDLVIRFVGDPDFHATDLLDMFKRLHDDFGIKKITGTVLIDAHQFDNIPYGPGWLWDDLVYGFAAPVDSVIINQNRFRVVINRSKKAGVKPSLENDLPIDMIPVHNYLRTVNKIPKSCVIAIYPSANNGVDLTGCLYPRKKSRHELLRVLAIRDPNLFAEKLIKSQLQQSAIQFDGDVITRHEKIKMDFILRHESRPLIKLVHHLLRTSDNIYAESFIKTVSVYNYKNRSGGFSNGSRAVRKKVYSELKHKLQWRYDDGSGLSRYDATSPEILNQWLFNRYKKFKDKDWLTLFPQPNKKGVLRYLYFHLKPKVKILAKTGSMTGVISLAGYVKAEGHQPISFAIIVNGFEDERRYKKLIEQWVNTVLQPAALMQAKSKVYTFPDYKVDTVDVALNSIGRFQYR